MLARQVTQLTTLQHHLLGFRCARGRGGCDVLRDTRGRYDQLARFRLGFFGPRLADISASQGPEFHPCLQFGRCHFRKFS